MAKPLSPLTRKGSPSGFGRDKATLRSPGTSPRGRLTHTEFLIHPLDGLPEPPWTAEILVFDTVYTPRMTKLLKLAKRKNGRIITGDEMFVRQAAIQFAQFTSQAAPTELFRQVMKKMLSA